MGATFVACQVGDNPSAATVMLDPGNDESARQDAWSNNMYIMKGEGHFRVGNYWTVHAWDGDVVEAVYKVLANGTPSAQAPPAPTTSAEHPTPQARWQVQTPQGDDVTFQVALLRVGSGEEFSGVIPCPSYLGAPARAVIAEVELSASVTSPMPVSIVSLNSPEVYWTPTRQERYFVFRADGKPVKYGDACSTSGTLQWSTLSGASSTRLVYVFPDAISPRGPSVESSRVAGALLLLPPMHVPSAQKARIEGSGVVECQSTGHDGTRNSMYIPVVPTVIAPEFECK